MTTRKVTHTVLVFVAFILMSFGAINVAAKAQAAGCALSASTYYASSVDNIHGVANRSGCGNSRSVTAALYHDMPAFLPDARLASASRTIRNGSVTVVSPANRGWNYFTKASDSSGASARSAIYAH